MLVGRVSEWAAIEAQLSHAAAAEGGVVLLRGEAGVGKSTLLERAAEAPEFRVLSATGVEAESEFPYATVHQLLLPLLPLLDGIPEGQAEAVRVALGMGSGDAPDRFLVALGLLSLVSEAASERPLLLLVDDLQWCDRASVDAIFFLGRRLAAEPVALVLAVRDEQGRTELPGSLAGAPSFPEVRVQGVAAADAAELVASVAGVRPPDSVAAQLAERTRGNPLAILEVARLLSPDELAGARPLPPVLPLGDRLENAFLDRARGLSEDAGRLLVLAAVDEVGELDILATAAELERPEDAVTELERTGVVTVRSGRLTFAHPLARSAVLSDATTDQRLAAHRDLGRVLEERGDPDRALWHRAGACLGPDEDVAAALEALAHRSRERAGHAAAAAAHERAAELSPAARDRTRRLIDAADAAWFAGQPQRASTLVDRAEQGADQPGEKARILELRARTASRGGDTRLAHRQLMSAAALLRDEQPEAAREMYAEAVEAAGFAGDVERLAEVVEAASGLRPGDSPRQEFLATWATLNLATMQNGVVRDAERQERVLALADQLDDPRQVIWAGISALNLGDVPGMLHCYQRALDMARSAGAVGSLPYVLEHSAVAQAFAGHFATARSTAEEGLRLALETEQQRSVSQLHAVLAFLAGSVGDEEACLTHAREARDIAVPLGLGLPISMTAWATSRMDLAAGRYDAAVDALLTLTAAGPDVGHPVITLWSTVDLVEAAVRARREADVAGAMERLQRVAEAQGPLGAGAALSWCQGLLGGVQATERLTEAAEVFRAFRIPLAEARIRLWLGEVLRRDRHPRQARDHLRAAVETFQRLGAERWAERATAELRASGEAAPSTDSNGLEKLTPQELQIVRYVAQGASNRDVAAQLFISPRTVEYHLYKAYPKLGVSSRTQLVGALRDEPALAGAG